MTKQQIINHIAVKLNALIQNGGVSNEISLFANLLMEITREDDFSYGSQLTYSSQPSNSYPQGVDSGLRNGFGSVGSSAS